MRMMIAGSGGAGDPGFVKWYLGVIHHATSIDRLIFMVPASSGDYKAAKEWASKNKVDHVEYPEVHAKFLKYEKEGVDVCLCFKASYMNGRTSSRIKNLAVDQEISILEAPQETMK